MRSASDPFASSHDDDASDTRRLYVDVVHAGARTSDGTQLGRSVDQSGRHTRRAANNDGVGILEVIGKLFRRSAGTRIDVPPFLVQQFNRRGGEVVGNKNLHVGYLLRAEGRGYESKRNDKRRLYLAFWNREFCNQQPTARRPV